MGKGSSPFWTLYPLGMQAFWLSFGKLSAVLSDNKCITGDPDNEAAVFAEASFLQDTSSASVYLLNSSLLRSWWLNKYLVFSKNL